MEKSETGNSSDHDEQFNSTMLLNMNSVMRLILGQLVLYRMQDEFELHYAGFKTPHIHNLSDHVQVNLGTQARKIGRLQLSDTSDDAPNVLVFLLDSEAMTVGQAALGNLFGGIGYFYGQSKISHPPSST